MHPRKLKNINIYILEDFKSIKINLKRVSHKNAHAFYYHKDSAIYIKSKKINEYILAHEMAHAIISNFFLVKPPANTQEILAVYCDTHLKDSNDYINRNIS